MVLLFIEGTQTFSIYDDDREALIFILLAVKHLLPNPESLGARVDCGPHLESFDPLILSLLAKLLHKQFVKQV